MSWDKKIMSKKKEKKSTFTASHLAQTTQHHGPRVNELDQSCTELRHVIETCEELSTGQKHEQTVKELSKHAPRVNEHLRSPALYRVWPQYIVKESIEEPIDCVPPANEWIVGGPFWKQKEDECNDRGVILLT